LNALHIIVYILVTPLIKLMMNLNIIDEIFTFDLDPK